MTRDDLRWSMTLSVSRLLFGSLHVKFEDLKMEDQESLMNWVEHHLLTHVDEYVKSNNG